jgi:hypothetical protein
VITVVLVAVTAAVVAASAAGSVNDWPYAGSSGASAARPAAAVLAAVGDIACEPDTSDNASTPASLKCGSPTLGGQPAEYATAAQAVGMHPDLVALLGDEQYEVGKLSDFENSFEQTWGGLKALERPAPGNHEYYPYAKHGDNESAQNGSGYFAYFNGHDATGTPYPQGQAGDYNKGWYSYNLGAWHIISLNAECSSAPFNNDCSTSDGGLLSQETSWLAQDLNNNHQACTLAYWHQPTFSATTTSASTANPSAPGVGGPEGTAADSWWSLLYAAHATLILNGHEHVYARFKPMDPAGNVNQKTGITQFTIGTGGEDLDTLARTNGTSFDNPNVVTGEDNAFGVAKLTLGLGYYSWNFQPTMAGPGFDSSVLSYQDSGSARCVRR